MALFQCILAVFVAAGVAVQPEAPVRRHREQVAAPDCSTNLAFDLNGAVWKGRCFTLDDCRNSCTGGCKAFNWWPKKGGCRHYNSLSYTTRETNDWSTIGGTPDCELNVTGPTDCGTCSPCQTPPPPATEWCGNGITNPSSKPDKCCAASCGTCGGSKCGGRPGGKSQCCHSGINDVCTSKDQTGCVIPSVTWTFDPKNSTSHRSNCETVCKEQTGKSCNQEAMNALTDDASVIKAYASAGYTCNSQSLSHNCEPNNCVSWGAPYLHNSHMGSGAAGICFGGTPSNGANRVANCGQSPVDGWHRRLCACR